MKNMFKAGFACIFLVLLVACGGGGSSTVVVPAPTPTPTPSGTLSVTPASTTVGFGQQNTFKAKNADGSTAVVNWSVNGIPGGNSSVGTITSAGLYTAPGSGALLPGKSVTITAALQSAATTTANANTIIDNNADAQTSPVELGTSGGNSTDSVSNATTITCCSGTLGSLVTDGTSLFILSNNHVLAKSDAGAKTTDPITQPGLVDNNCAAGTTVGTFFKAAALKPANGTNGPAPSNVDAALATTVPGTVDPAGNILDLGAATGNVIAAAPPSSTLAVAPTAGLQVAKSGRSTGLTCNTLAAVANVTIDYAASCGGPKAFTSTFANQVIVNGGNFSASGDSGSLIVDAATARPIGLLYGGNSTSTTANPIQEVLAKLGALTGSTLSIVGGPDHAVACNVVGTSGAATLTVSASSATLTAEEATRANNALDRFPAALRRNPAISDVTVGVSADNPREAALLVHTTKALPGLIPATINGVRTRIMNEDSASANRQITVASADFQRAMAVKDAHTESMLGRDGVFGVGASMSDDSPGEAAVVFYVENGFSPVIPPVMDGLRTKVIETDRFRAYNWGKDTKTAPTTCKSTKPKVANIKAKLK